ncbi:hypothetical protein ACFWP7_37330 [Streptomyces sp. NPDC058470]|uniref:hypothetical protein n=1 Tax=Streptomyces sp. NPDC058470 TaxID=3346515 RepID=UPI00364AD249
MQRSGLASACVTTSRQLGTTMGVAVLGLIVATQGGSAPAGENYADGFVSGLHIAGLASGIATLAGAMLVSLSARTSGTSAAKSPRTHSAA